MGIIMAMSTRRKEQNNSSSSPLLSTNSINTSKTTKFPILSDDIMIIILNALPQKTLLKFCIVCKSWLDMIRNPHRSDSVYSLRLKSNPLRLNLLAFFHVYKNFRWEPLIFSPLDSHSSDTNIGNTPLVLQNTYLSKLYNDTTIKVDASSNTYILCHRCYYDPIDNISRWYYYVINPFSRQWLDLPMIESSLTHFVGFRCEVDSTSPLAAAHFTVVLDNSRIRNSFDRSVLELRVLCSKNRGNVPGFQWRKLSVDLQYGLGDTFDAWRHWYFERGVILDGVIYWIHKDILEAVDLNTAKGYKIIKVPYDYSNYPWRNRDMTNYTMLGVFENKLFFGYQYYGDKTIRVYVYEGELVEDRGSWVLKYTMLPEVLVSSSSIYKGITDEGLMVNLNGFHPKNPAIFFFNICEHFMSYNAQTQCLVVHYTGIDSCSYTLCEWSDGWPRSLPLAK